MLPLSDHFKENLSLRALKYVYSKVVEYEQITFRSKGGKEQIMLPLSDHFTCQG